MKCLAVIFKDNLLTLEDFMVIHRVLIGCTKMLYSIEIRFYNDKKGVFIPSLKKHAGQSVYNIVNNGNKNTHFSQTQLQSTLLGEVRNIDRSDLYDVLKQYKNIRVLQKENNLKRHRGKPSIEDSKLTRRNSIYSADPYFISLNKTLDKIEARVIIFGCLFESNLLTRYLDVCHYARIRQLLVFGAEKMTHNIKKLGVLTEKDLEAFQLKLKQQFNALRKLDDKQLRDLSREETEFVLKLNSEKNKRWNENWCRDFFLRGGISYNQQYEPEFLDSI